MSIEKQIFWLSAIMICCLSLTFYNCGPKLSDGGKFTAQSLPFTIQFGTEAYDSGTGVAVDSLGNIIVLASTSGAFNDVDYFGCDDLLLVKYDSAGKMLWSQQLGTSETDIPIGVVVGKDGSIYATGITMGNIDGNPLHYYGEYDFFLAKFDQDGNKKCLDQRGTPATDYSTGIALDSAGNVYITGSTYGGLDGNTNLSTDTSDFFIVKYDSSDNCVRQWTKQIGSAGAENDFAYGIALDNDTNSIIVTGWTEGVLDVKTTLPGTRDLFVSKFDISGSGNPKWIKQLGVDYASTAATGIALGPDSSIYLTGLVNGQLGVLSPHRGLDDFFIIKYNGSGVLQWIRQSGTTGADEIGSIVVDNMGNAYLTGTTPSSPDGQCYSLNEQICFGDRDIFLVKYDPILGETKWTKQVGTTFSDHSYGAFIDSNSVIYLTGATEGGLNENGNLGKADAFVLKFNSFGESL